MPTLQLCLAAAGALLVMAALAWRQKALAGHGALSLSLLLGSVYFLYQSAPGSWQWLLPVVCLGPLAFNRAVRAGFEQPQRPAWLDALVALACVATGLFGLSLPGRIWAWAAFDVLALALIGELGLVVWRGYRDDLLDRRRNLRLGILAVSVGLALLMALISITRQSALASGLGGLAVVILCLGLIVFDRPNPSKPSPNHPETVPNLDDRDTRQLLRLRKIMHTDEVWRQPGLTLSRLARRLELSEHALRRLIRIGENHDNFSQYINELRIDWIIDALGWSDQPILQLAIDAGYNSLSAFNRAFKKRYDSTPSAYRLALTASAKASPAPPAEITAASHSG